MALTFLMLLLLGLCVSHGFQAQEGWLPKPSIRAAPGPVVPQGSALSISCRGPPGTAQHRLARVGHSQVWQKESLQSSQEEAEFFFQRVTASQAGPYICQYEKQSHWSESSDPLELQVVGVFRDRPTLSAQPSPMVALGGTVTLLCHLPHSYDAFILSKGAELAFPHHPVQAGQGSFQLSPVIQAHAGTYRCYGSVNASLHQWSVPSNLLDLRITGVYRKPQLSALLGPSVSPWQKMILQCHSEMWFDLFLLSQEGSANSTWRLPSQYQRGLFWANFTMNASQQAQGATYRCYGSLSTFPFLWSDPSEPLTLSERGSVSWNYIRVNMLRLSLAGVILLVLLGFLVEAWFSRKHPLGAAKRPLESPGWDRVL